MNAPDVAVFSGSNRRISPELTRESATIEAALIGVKFSQLDWAILICEAKSDSQPGPRTQCQSNSSTLAVEGNRELRTGLARFPIIISRVSNSELAHLLVASSISLR